MRQKQIVKVSAIVPVYNAKTTLLRAVNSLLIQPEINEIILVEDGSKDESLELCKQLAFKHEIIQLFTHPDGENKGAPASRNLGLTKISNKWVQFMDADDELLPDKIRLQVEKVNSNTSLVIGHFFKCDENVTITYLKDIWSGLLATRLGNTTANLWNAEVIKKVGGWNESLLNMQEYHLMFDMLQLDCKVRFSPENLSFIYPQPNSITNSCTNQSQKRDTYFKFRFMVRDYLITNGIYTLKRQHYYNICTGQMLKYHYPSFEVTFNKAYYFFYKSLKKLELSISNIIKLGRR